MLIVRQALDLYVLGNLCFFWTLVSINNYITEKLFTLKKDQRSLLKEIWDKNTSSRENVQCGLHFKDFLETILFIVTVNIGFKLKLC